jgi:hypothetical protein
MTYIIKSTLQRNGKVYVKGDQAPEMPEKELQLLAGIGVVGQVDVVEAPKVTDGTVVEKINAPSIRWSKIQLADYAKSHGVKFDALDTKQEIFEKINGKNDQSVVATA